MLTPLRQQEQKKLVIIMEDLIGPSTRDSVYYAHLQHCLFLVKKEEGGEKSQMTSNYLMIIATLSEAKEH
jgi:hypothetical protein